MQTPELAIDAAERAFIDQTVAASAGHPGSLLGILEAVQEHNRHKYLPLATLAYVAARTDTPLSRVFSVATFYSLFNLAAQGEHTVSICSGTACHILGSRKLLHSLCLDLGVAPDGTEEDYKLRLTTPDGRFTIRTVACFGQCTLAPAVEIDHRICGHVNERTLQREIRTLERERE